MALRRYANILILCLVSICVCAQTEEEQIFSPKSHRFKNLPLDSIYQGIVIKFDLGQAIYIPIRYKGAVQTYDFAANVRLFHKFFPTFEAGYAQARINGSSDNSFSGYGGFMRLGIDYSVLRKYKGGNHLFVGFRVGTSLQNYKYDNISRSGRYWGTESVNYPFRFGADAWGEIVAGVQVNIYKGFNMGWYLRYKILFTRGKTLDGVVRPAYIMGYGQRQETTFGWNYYIGWAF